MAKFTLTIECDNAAFEDAAGAEVARILRDAADDLDSHMMQEASHANLYDINGNTVGKWRYTL